MKNPADTRKPYSGLSRSLVIAIDVGTTFSGVSYAILEPGEIPKIHGVTRFPGQEHVVGNSKIPSIIYYDKHGSLMAAGAEAESSTVIAQAEDEGWIKAELFKLRLRPRTMQLNMNGMRLTPLPKRKTPVYVFGDYLAYLYRCTRSFITDTHANGTSLWNAVESDIQFVLSHPNGWEGPQQTRMRNAAVYGNLVPDSDAGKARIRFVTEGEASLHACVLSGLADDVLSNPSKNGFLIADAGGGTLDISSYAIRGTAPLAMEEIAPPDCIFAGSVFVSRRAREFFQEKLKNSRYGTPDALDHITRRFDETTKRLFRDRHAMQFVPFGSPLDKDSSVGIRNGQLKLSGNEVANLFEPSVDAAVTAIKAQIEASNGIIKSVFLVGGYAASPWLFTQLQERLATFKITVSRPDTQTSKAVADGAVGFYCDHHVSARMSKFMYGVEFLRELDPNNPDHERRKEKLCELPSGPKLLPDAFDCILARGVKVKESTVFTRKYCTELTNLSMLSVFEVEVWCYRGGNVVPEWINRHNDDFSTLCVVQADLSLLSGSAEPKQGKNGKKYWTIVFSVEIHFGLTEFKARMKWKDKDQTKFGPAVIVYNERGHRIEDDNIDVYPEDDFSSQSNNSRNNANGYSTSRSHTPVDSYYPPSGSNSRRTSNAVIPDVTRIEVSKGYTPSIAPSARSAAFRGSDGERTGSDSERRKGKGSYEDRDRGMPGGLSPIERTVSNGPISSPIAKVSSVIGGGEVLSSNRNPLSASASRSPSIKPQSRTQSIYGGDGEYNSAHDIQQSQPAVDEQRNSHLWDNPAPPISPRSAALDAILDRPMSGLGVHSRSHTPGGSRPRTPITHEPPASAYIANTPGIARSNTPFIDRPKSGIEGSFFDRPKSAFGSGSIYGDSGPAMFGDSGPAANIGAGIETSLFGDPPASVFGDAHTGESGFNDWDTTGEEGMHDWRAAGGEEVNNNDAGAGWGGAGHEDGGALGGAIEGGADDNGNTPVAEEPVVTTPTTKKEKNKRKNSNAISAPASGVASRASPALSTKKSPFENTADTGFYDDPASGARSITPIHGSGLLGSKAPSPLPLSPLNPASQMINDPSATTGQEEFNWGTGTAATGGETFDWNGAGLADNHTKPPTRVPSPIPPTPVEEPAAVEKEIVVTGKGKKKKKGSGATTPAKSPHALTQEAADKEEKERVRIEKAEQERLATEAADRLAKEEADREAKEKAEQERLAAEAAEKLAKEAQEAKERKEHERLATEAADRLAKEAQEAKEKAEQDRLAADAAEKLAREAQEAKERAEQERLATEVAEKLAEEARLQKEQAEHERLEQEREEQEKAEKDRLEKERAEHERLEQERLAQEEKNKATPVSAFGFGTPSLFSGGHFPLSSLNPPDKPWMSDTGGGDDSWGGGLGWGSSKKKKTKLGGKSLTGTPWGSTTPTATTPLAEEFSSSQDATGLLSFSSITPNLDLGFDDLKFKSGTASPVPPVDDPTPPDETNPTDAVKPESRPASPLPTPVDDPNPPDDPNPTDAVSPTAENDGNGEEDSYGVTVTQSKKKKKKGKGANVELAAETLKEEPSPLETPGAEDQSPAVETTPAQTGKKKKKGKK